VSNLDGLLFVQVGRAEERQGRPVAEVPAREGEEAFTVQTPGGAVVGGSGPVQPEPAPKPLISNG